MSDYSNTHWMKDSVKRDFFDDSEYFPKKMPNILLPPKDYEPLVVSIESTEIVEIIRNIQIGIDNTTELLFEHDANNGRRSPKSKWWAETLEDHISNMKICLEKLQKYEDSNDRIRLVEKICKETHYP